jgi:hypothetical protein
MHFLISILLVIAGCATMEQADRVYPTPHFKIVYTELDDKNIREIADSLERGYAAITAHLDSGDLPPVAVRFYTDITALRKGVKAASGPGVPDWAVGLVTGVSDIHMLSPNHPDHDYQTMIRNTRHEFVHCVSLQLNPAISNNPRWLWEAAALYEANLPWDPRMLPYLVEQKPPSLSELNEFSNPRIYEVGYFIAQFVAETKGRPALKPLIQNNGNVKDTLNVDEKEFTKQWFAFVKKKYGI